MGKGDRGRQGSSLAKEGAAKGLDSKASKGQDSSGKSNSKGKK